jgi:acetyl esterase/lipase
MLTALVKAGISASDVIGRAFIFNRGAESVGQAHLDQAYGGDSRHRVDVYVPESPPPHPVLVYFHGGGWISGRKENNSRVARYFAHRGYLVFNVEYRLAPRHRFPAQLHDVAQAIRWAYERAEEYGGDSRAMFLAGDSAGALLAAWYAAALGKEELFRIVGIGQSIPKEVVRGLLFFYGALNIREAFESRQDNGRSLFFAFLAGTMARAFLGPDSPERAERVALMSPTLHVKSGFPASYLCVGERDPLLSNSEAFVRALEANGVPHRSEVLAYEEYPEATHAFLNYPGKPCTGYALSEALAFLEGIRSGEAEQYGKI